MLSFQQSELKYPVLVYSKEDTLGKEIKGKLTKILASLQKQTDTDLFRLAYGQQQREMHLIKQ